MATNARGQSVIPTYYGQDGGKSRIGYLFIPCGLEDSIAHSHVLRRLGARLQAYQGPSPRDHLPIECTLWYAQHTIGPTDAQTRPRWDHDKLMSALQR
eukprot:7915419-Pyramimonas_sp.AAC.1